MYPKKWRETIDLFELRFDSFELKEIIGYPHAGNDVFVVKGMFEAREIIAYLKVERQVGADILREIQTIEQLNGFPLPKILDYSLKAPRYLLIEEIKGERLSTIVGDNENLQSLNYLKTYGETLGELHLVSGEFEPVKPRKFLLCLSYPFLKRMI